MREVQLAGVGLCEHCETLLTLEDMPLEAMNATWSCSACGGELSHKSFGYEHGGLEAQRVRWVGPDGKWTDQQPTVDFQLKHWLVMVPSSIRMRRMW